jgi:O-antigen/teichoic acid export membrane protein
MMDHLSNNKRVAKNTLLLYGRMLFSMLVSLYTARIVLNTLGASDYGLYNVVGGVIAVFGVFKALISTGTQRFLTFEMGKGSGEERLTAVFSTSLSIFLIIGGVIFVLGETLGFWFVNHFLNIPVGREFAANVVFQVSILAMLISVIQLPYSAAILSHERMEIYGYIGLGEPLLRLILILLLPLLPFDKLITYSILVLIVNMSASIVYIGVCSHLFPECKFRLRIDKPLFKKMMGFTIWNMLESISNMLDGQGLDILINFFFGTTVNASRSVANQVNQTVHGFASNFLVALFPQITKTYAANEFDECNKLMLKGAKFSYMILALLIVPLLLKMDHIMLIWLKNPPEDASLFCKLILIAMLIRMVTEPLYTGIQATGQVKEYQIWTSLLTLLNIPLCYVLYRRGMPAYVAFVISIGMSFVLMACRLFFVRRLINFPVREYLKCVFIDCIGVSLLAYIPLRVLSDCFENTFFNLIWISLLAVLITGCLFFVFSMTKGERQFISDIVINKALFLIGKK